MATHQLLTSHLNHLPHTLSAVIVPATESSQDHICQPSSETLDLVAELQGNGEDSLPTIPVVNGIREMRKTLTQAVSHKQQEMSSTY